MTDLPVERVPETQIISALPHEAMPRLMELAVEKGGVEALERLVAMNERMMAASAAREFAAAMAAFQEECPPVRKTSTAKVVMKSGGSFSYPYAELDEIARTVRPFLHKHGLSYSWDCKFSEDGSRVRVECVLAHANGHKATASFEAPTAALTDAMSPQQKAAAALTFGRRQTLIEALGLTTCDPDDDGRSEPEAVITPAQVLELEALIDQRPSGARERLLGWTKIEWGATQLEQIPAARFAWLKADIQAKLDKGAK